MRFFKTKKTLVLAWFDGRQLSLLAEPNPSETPLVVLLSSDESCQWQVRPKLHLWQAWLWFRALVRRARYRATDSASRRYYARPIMGRWQGQAVYLQQQWEPHQTDLIKLDRQAGIGLYGFNQWWQAWWPQSAMRSLLLRQPTQAWVMVHLQLAPKRWVQFAHYQQQACWWRVLNERDAINWSFEYQRFVDYLQQQPLLPVPAPAYLIWIDPQGYQEMANPNGLAASDSAAVFAEVKTHAIPHSCRFDAPEVLTRLHREKPLYALAPWFQSYLTLVRRRRLIRINGVLAAWLGLWLTTLIVLDPFWHTGSNKANQLHLPPVQSAQLQPYLTHRQQQQITSELIAFRQRYQAWQSQAVNEQIQAIWQQLTDQGMSVEKVQWSWHPDGYWHWQVKAQLAGSQRHQLVDILATFAHQQTLTGRLAQWRVDLQGLEVELGRLQDPQQGMISVDWNWQLWP